MSAVPGTGACQNSSSHLQLGVGAEREAIRGWTECAQHRPCVDLPLCIRIRFSASKRVLVEDSPVLHVLAPIRRLLDRVENVVARRCVLLSASVSYGTPSLFKPPDSLGIARGLHRVKAQLDPLEPAIEAMARGSNKLFRYAKDLGQNVRSTAVLF